MYQLWIMNERKKELSVKDIGTIQEGLNIASHLFHQLSEDKPIFFSTIQNVLSCGDYQAYVVEMKEDEHEQWRR